MIIDRIQNRSSYSGISPLFDEAFDFALSLRDKAPGRYECGTLPAGEVYAMVQEGETKPFDEGLIEAHRRYLDVQIMLSGGETVFYQEIEGLKEAVPYSEEKDIIFFEKAGQPVQIREDMFYVVFPQDGHMPCRHLEGPGSYRKIVLKIKAV